jgi:MraZ protein
LATFLGQYAHAVDDKNRLFLPAKLRHKQKGADFILTQGLEGCLYLYPPAAWDRLASRLDQLPLADKKEERAFKRMLLAAACEVEVDSQGRILIPQILREFAGLRHEAVILGVLQHVEIWARERWTAYQAGARDSFEKASAHLEL